MLKLETDRGVIGLGYVSVLLAFLFDFEPNYGFRFYGLVFVSELMCASVLCLGVVKQKPIYLLPWLIINGFFTFYVLLLVMVICGHFNHRVKVTVDDWEIFVLPIIVFVIPFVAIYSVCQAFCRMRKDRAQPTSTSAV